MKTISIIISINILSIVMYFNHLAIYFIIGLLLVSTLLSIYSFVQTYKLQKYNEEHKEALKMVKEYLTQHGIITSELLIK